VARSNPANAPRVPGMSARPAPSHSVMTATSVARDERAPTDRMVSWTTPGGIEVIRTAERIDGAAALTALESALDQRRGLLMSSRYDHPGRYRHGDLGYVDPPVEVVARGRTVSIRALNERGQLLLPALLRAIPPMTAVPVSTPKQILLSVPEPEGFVAEEERTRRPSVFTVLRGLTAALASPDDPVLGLYGAFGYDLILQFEPVPTHRSRDPQDRDLVLHLPDEILDIDPAHGTAVRYRYDFIVDGRATTGLPRATPPAPYADPAQPPVPSDHTAGEYAALVEVAKRRFRAGDLFEVVPGQCFHRPCAAPPSEVFRRLRHRNPSPYGLLVNLGDGEHLVGASPEMFVRVDRRDGELWVESCPISGTIARGRDALEDARQIQRLLGSTKEESELTMCTDVDRNDKARVCEPGSIAVVGRRMIETYATLIHTVDHVQGRLLPGRDALDAFLTHTWAVTVTGAPKRAAVAFIEEHERSPRRWYGGAVGRIGCNGGIETALTLRTIQIRDGVATVRAGATLLYDSDPLAEEAETVLKAHALLHALETGTGTRRPAVPRRIVAAPPRVPRVVLVDHEDSFVHTLSAYFRHAGATVTTYRYGFPTELLDSDRPDLLVLSPGPGRPADFGLNETLDAALLREIPVFGVCLGLQGIVEYFGGTLGVLDTPVHGKSSRIELANGGGAMFAGLPPAFEVGRYHSLHADPATLPAELTLTARTADGVVMAAEHVRLPVSGVQFHPESIMTQGGRCGHAIVANAVARASLRRPTVAAIAPMS
jgi:anthranilate synthase